MNVIAKSKFGPIIVSTNDQFIGDSIIKTGTWAAHDQALIGEILVHILHTNAKAMVYDVGANNGIHTLFLAKAFANAVTVRAFEAQQEIFYMLCGTVAINNLRNVICHFNAVSRRSGEWLSFDLPDYDTRNNFGGLELVPALHSDNQDIRKTSQKQDIETVTLDSFDEKVDFIKLDIEGMELLALHGARACISTHNPYVFCELAKSERSKIFEFFKVYHYSLYHNRYDGVFLPPGARFDAARLVAYGFQPVEI